MNIKWVIGLCVLFGFTSVYAQETEQRTYTDEELASYAGVMVWAELQKQKMTDDYNELIKNDELMQGGKRFLELKDAAGDTAKLEGISATPEEIAAYELIQVKYDSMTTTFKETYVSKIKDDIGAGLYNDLRKDLKKDDSLKARYEDIYNEKLNSQAQASESQEPEASGG